VTYSPNLLEQLVILAGATATGGIAGTLALLWNLHGKGRAATVRKRRRAEDEHAADVRAWRDTSGAVTAHLNPVPVVAASPLPESDWPERAGRMADLITGRLTEQERHTYGPGRHRAAGVRDLRRPTWQRNTAVFAQIVEQHTGAPLESVGPPERMVHTRIVWDAQTGWSQPELDVGIPS